MARPQLIKLYSNNSSEAAQSVAQLHEIVAKILQSNHENLIQLRELIKRNNEGADFRPPISNHRNAEHHNESNSNYIPGSLLTPGSGLDDNDSAKSPVSSFSIRSMSRSMSSLLLPSFTEGLLSSRAYRI